MKSESESMPAETEVLGERIVVRSNVQTVTRTEDGKARTVYQYDEVAIIPDGKTTVATLLDRAVKREQGSGIAAVPKGAARVIIPHGLGFAPPNVSVAGIVGAKVFTLGSEGILVILPSETKSAGTLTWTAGAEPAGTIRTVDAALVSRVEMAIAVKAIEPVEEVIGA